MSIHIAYKYVVLNPETTVGAAVQQRAKDYLHVLSIAATWECIFDLLATAAMATGSVLTALAFHDLLIQTLPIALLAGLVVLVACAIPARPSTDSLGSIIRRICMLSVLALLARFVEVNPEQLGASEDIHQPLDAALPGVLFASVAAVSTLTLLLIICLVRQEWVGRLLRANAQQILTIELIGVVELLDTQRECIEWHPGSAAEKSLSRLETASRLIERHAWYPTKKLSENEKRKLGKIMNKNAATIRRLRADLIHAKDGTVDTLRDEVLRIAVLANRGFFGALSVPVVERDVRTAVRLRASLTRLVRDLPLALAPVLVIWLFDLIGLDAPDNHLARGSLLGAGASFSLYVVVRALDPSTTAKLALSSTLLDLLRMWLQKSDSKTEKPADEPDSKPTNKEDT